MTNPFNSLLAQKYCTELIHTLETQKCLDFEKAPENRNKLFSTEELFTKNGCMFGILICHTIDKKEIVLKAFSGQFKSHWVIDNWCKPLLNIEDYTELVSKTDPEIQSITNELKKTVQNSHEFTTLYKKRSTLSQKAFSKIQDLYNFLCADGVKRKFSDIVTSFIPTGTGDCCAPKLLNEAFSRNLTPISMAEFYFGKPTDTKKHLQFYEPCDEKCKIILPTMLGLDIVYKDEDIIVIKKKSGDLSVPGRGENKQDCIVNRIKTLFPECIEQPSVHRLDMDTSGLMVFGLTKEAQRSLSIGFEKGNTKKKYIAVLEGNILEKDSTKKVGHCESIKLPFRLDIENRPYQIYDEINGKMGVTKYKILAIKKNKLFKTTSKYVTYVEYEPLTGRTHQLRLHSFHEKGLGLPIIGDRLYGNAKYEYTNDNYGKGSLQEGRLLLHASYLEFTHPITNERLYFESPSDF